jgi:hypothetical protein
MHAHILGEQQGADLDRKKRMALGDEIIGRLCIAAGKVAPNGSKMEGVHGGEVHLCKLDVQLKSSVGGYEGLKVRAHAMATSEDLNEDLHELAIYPQARR